MKILNWAFNSKVFRYLFVGGSAFILDFSIIWLLHEIFQFELWISTIIAGCVAFIFTYTLQKNFAFKSNSPTISSLFLYIMLVLFNMIATVIIVQIGNNLGSWEIGRTFAAIIIPVWNYFIYNRLIFPQ